MDDSTRLGEAVKERNKWKRQYCKGESFGLYHRAS